MLQRAKGSGKDILNSINLNNLSLAVREKDIGRKRKCGNAFH